MRKIWSHYLVEAERIKTRKIIAKRKIKHIEGDIRKIARSEGLVFRQTKTRVMGARGMTDGWGFFENGELVSKLVPLPDWARDFRNGRINPRETEINNGLL